MRLFSRVILQMIFGFLGMDSSGKYEEERQSILKMIAVVSLVVIGMILCTALFFTKPELKEWSTGLDAEPVLTMEDFGYQDSIAPDAAVFAVTFDNERVANCYKLRLSAEEGKKYIELDVYHLDEGIDADPVYQSIVEQRVTSYRKTAYGYRNYMPDIKYERAIEQMIQLDADSWDAEEAYAHNELNAQSDNLFLVKRKHEILVLRITGIELSKEVQNVLLKGIDQLIIQDIPE